MEFIPGLHHEQKTAISHWLKWFIVLYDALWFYAAKHSYCTLSSIGKKKALLSTVVDNYLFWKKLKKKKKEKKWLESDLIKISFDFWKKKCYLSLILYPT